MIFVIVIFILSLDQFTKSAAVKNLLLNQSSPVIENIFHLTLIHNRGAAFGILKNQTPIFIVTAIATIVLIYLNLKRNHAKILSLYTFSLTLILAGAIGNLIDRARCGYVIDFLDFRIWPVFNVADSAITVGAILLGYCICFRKSAK